MPKLSVRNATARKTVRAAQAEAQPSFTFRNPTTDPLSSSQTLIPSIQDGGASQTQNLAMTMSPQVTRSRKKSAGNLNQSSFGALSGVLLDEEYMLSNSEDDGEGDGTGKHKIRTKRDRKGSSPMKLLDMGDSLNS